MIPAIFVNGFARRLQQQQQQQQPQRRWRWRIIEADGT
jgi:hypothetical protein